MLDPVEFGKAMAAIVKEATAPLLKRIDELEARHPEKGDKGDPGDAGKSITLDDVSLFLDAAVAKHVLDFERRANESLAKVIDKIPVPKDGRDGADLTELSVDFDGERTVTVKGRTGEVTKRIAVPLWRGYWTQGVAAEKADILTHNGTAYIAIVDNPKCEPGVGKYDHEWKVFTRKGRDGRDANKPPQADGPVKLKGDDDA